MSAANRVTLRASQIVTAFGPGAMVDLPTRSVVIGGLDLWHMRERDSWKPIDEPRAVAVLQALEQFVLYTGVRPGADDVAHAAAFARGEVD